MDLKGAYRVIPSSYIYFMVKSSVIAAKMLTSNLALACTTFFGFASASPSLLTPRQAEDPSKNYINVTDEKSNDVVLEIPTKAMGRNATAPLLYGWMIEGTQGMPSHEARFH